MPTDADQVSSYSNLATHNTYQRQVDQLKTAQDRAHADADAKFKGWRETNEDGDASLVAPFGTRLSEFIALLEEQLSKSDDPNDGNRLRDGQDGYTRAGNSNVIISDRGYLSILGEDKSDAINTYNNATVAGRDGDDDISSYNHGVVWGGDGDDDISAYNNTHASGGRGDDRIKAYDNARILGGRGDDLISAYDNAQIASGAGNDRVEIYDNGVVDAGAGHDAVTAYSNATITLGSGNDYAYAGGTNSRINGGLGDDMITGGNNAQLFGGEGDDHIGSRNNALIDAGSGDDRIFTGNNSVVIGGAGDDYARIGDNTSVLFNKGDGWDVIAAMPKSSIGSGTISNSRMLLGPDIAVADLDIVRRGPHLVIGVQGTNDAIVIRNVDTTKIPSLVFSDGTTLSDTDIAAMTRVDDSPLEERLKTAGNKKMLGSSGDDHLSNLADAEVWAGAGTDAISVASDSTVHFGRGDGNDVLRGALSWHGADIAKQVVPGQTNGPYTTMKADHTNAHGTLDTSRVLFNDDISPDDVTVTFEGNNLIISINGTADTLTIPDMGRIADPSHIRPKQTAPNLEFADGTRWSSADVLAKADAAGMPE